MPKKQKKLTEKQKEEKNKIFKIHYDLLYHADTIKQINMLNDLQDLCKYNYRGQYLTIQREKSNEIGREKKKVSKALETLHNYVESKHNDPVLIFLVDTINKRLDTDLRVTANKYIDQKKDEFFEKLLAVGFIKIDIKNILIPTLIKYIKDTIEK